MLDRWLSYLNLTEPNRKMHHLVGHVRFLASFSLVEPYQSLFALLVWFGGRCEDGNWTLVHIKSEANKQTHLKLVSVCFQSYPGMVHLW